MEAWEVYSELKSWQSGIAAIVGFFALMAAALWNFHLNRRRDAAVQQAEMLSVLAAIYAEIIQLRQQAALVARIVAQYEMAGRDFDTQFSTDYLPDEPIVFPALASRLGLIEPKLVVSVVRFYSDYQELRRSLPLISVREGVVYSVLTVLQPAVDAVYESRALLARAEEELNLPGSDVPDIGYADAVIETAKLNRIS